MPLSVVTASPDTPWTAEVKIGPEGAVPFSMGFAYGTGSQTTDLEYQYCPTTFRPTNVVNGKVSFESYTDEGDFTVESSFRFEVGIVRAATQTTITKVTRDQFGYVQVTGRVSTTSQKYGRVGTYGQVFLMMKGAKGRWTRVGEAYAAGAFGEFTAMPVKPIKAKRASFRVDYVGTDATAPSISQPKSG
jgi:hypothetical protein